MIRAIDLDYLINGGTELMLKIGVVGYGYWGPNLVRNFSEIDEARVVAVSDLNDARLKLVKARYPTIDITTDYRQLIARTDIDAILIATPVSAHYPIALESLKAGRHKLCLPAWMDFEISLTAW